MIQSLFNIFLVMACYTLSRLFFYLLHLDLFSDVTTSHLFEMLAGGTRFDLTAVLYLSSLYLLLALLPFPRKIRTNRIYATVQKYSFLVPNILGILVNSADMVYFNFTNRRTTCTFFTEFRNEGNLFTIFIESVFQYWYISLFAIALCVALFFLYRPYRPLLRPSFLQRPIFYYTISSILFPIAGYFMVIGIRGGFGAYTRPITISNAAQYVDRPIENALVLNTPFTLMMSIQSKTYVNPQYFPDDLLAQIMSPEHHETYAPLFQDKPNVVIFILESFAAEHIGFYNPDSKPFTPFLDSILSNSIVFRHAYSCGRKSIDACPSILSSIPTLYEPYVLSPYSTNAVSSIADVLSRQGYSTSFFHGAPNGSMGFAAYVRSIHFKEYYGMDEYMADPLSDKDAFDGTWAIWDEEFLAYYARTLGNFHQPFFSSLFTASSHHPFVVPDRYKGKLPEGEVPLLKCIAYTDHALKGFFDYASRQPWFDNTIFIFVADHTNQPIRPEYLTDEGLFRIPIAFYIPRLASSVSHLNYPYIDTTNIVSQADIFPSLMALIGTDTPFFAFGQDAITTPKTHNYAVTFLDPYFQIISSHGFIQFDGTQVISVNGDIPEDEKQDMIAYLKAYIQQYVVRLINNQMTVKR